MGRGKLCCEEEKWSPSGWLRGRNDSANRHGDRDLSDSVCGLCGVSAGDAGWHLATERLDAFPPRRSFLRSAPSFFALAMTGSPPDIWPKILWHKSRRGYHSKESMSEMVWQESCAH